ncbi:MAG: selenium cofactor biosynthesis protein YqeC [Chloroflexi bacterium]|nr:selenium cofactor biosynthesis protein YqeC [Chloroflexota bacterium]
MLSLSQALRVTKSQAVAFVGAGGKTSAMFRVAGQFAPALVTCSTHLGAWQAGLADSHLIWESDGPMPEMESQLGRGITLVTGALDLETQRYRGLSAPQLEKLRQLAGYHDLPLLIEADGSRQKALKAPGEYEPVIPSFVDVVVVVAGLTGLGQALSAEVVHRPQIFASLAEIKAGEIITPLALAKVLSHADGGLKNIPSQARRLVLLNQADTAELQSQANEISQLLISVFDAVVVTVLQPQPGSVLAIKEDIAALILAAGASTRYGQPKQLLDYRGKPFVRALALTALQAGLFPVNVVCGANSEAVSAVVKDLPVRIVNNPDWQAGQSTSIKAGLRDVPGKNGGAFFLMADQPQVPIELLRAMVERHSQDLPPVLAPYVFDQRANPFLFDRVTFDALLTITGDNAGRAIFSTFSPRYLNWFDRRLLLDVDTPADYQKLLAAEVAA